MSIQLLYSPFPTLDSARAAAQALVEQRLVACCNLLPAGESLYLWEGALTSANEVILIAKTSAQNLEKARKMLAQGHPYTCPAILSFAADANSAFVAYIEASTS